MNATSAPERGHVRTRARAPSLARFTGPRVARQLAVGYVLATIGTIALTATLLPFRDDITPLAKGFGYLVVVVVAAAVGGLWPGIVASVFGFVTFNFFFLPPYDTFLIGRGEYVVVLFVFLGLSILISTLLARASDRARAAEAREQELEALQTLSAELVAAVPGPECYARVLDQVLLLFGFSAGALYVQDPSTRDLREQVVVGAAPGELSPRWDPRATTHPPERLPLSVGGRNLGLFVLRSDRQGLTPAESRVLRAFCDEFALVLERDRLLRSATEAEVYRQSDQVRRSLIGAVSHDLRSPLAAIKASVTDLLEADTAREPEAAREALESIDHEADRLSTLIANLLDMSRIESGMLSARPQGVEMTDVLVPCVDRIKAQWPGIEVALRLHPNASLVRADPVFLERVLTNLLNNAARAASENRSDSLEVEARREGGSVTIRVVDHGPGVPDGVREQLFYPFYQVTERHPRLGTGLGLAISKGFLNAMGGQIWIEETPGGGATFAISLPAQVDRTPAAVR